MGYDAYGTITVTITEQVELAMALRSAELDEVVNTQATHIIDRFIEVADVDDAYTSKEPGVTTVTLNQGGRLGDALDSALAFAASCGAGVYGTLTGEDDYSWSYDSAVGSGELEEIELLRVDHRLMLAAAKVTDWAKEHGTDNLPAELAAHIAELIRRMDAHSG